MKRFENAVYLLIAVSLAIFASYVWIGTGLFQSYLLPDTPEGYQSLGHALEAGDRGALQSASFADVTAKIFEFVAAFTTWIFGMVVAVLTPIVRWITAKLYALTHDEQTPHSDQPQEVQGVVSASPTPPRELITLLFAAIDARDKFSTVRTIELMAGTPYLTQKSSTKPAPQEVDANGFPVKG